jgi:signal transduction histidine kinase
MELDPALPAMHGDSGQLQQVLMNLIGNSVKPSNNWAERRDPYSHEED